MRHVLIALLPILLIGCSGTDGEPERKPERNERKARVQALIKQLADKSLENRQVAYAELRDTFVRKRDIPELTKEIARNANPEVTKSLRKLVTFMKGRWRLPDKGWTTDIDECDRRYKREFQDLGFVVLLTRRRELRDKPIADLFVLDDPITPKNRTGAIKLIFTLEPEILKLTGSWTNITDLATLANLESLELNCTSVTDLTPLKGLRNLWLLDVSSAGVTDLTPLKGMQNLWTLDISSTGVTDLTPLKGMPKLRHLHLSDTKVTDLTPLKGMPELETLYLQNTGVTDLTPLKGMPNLEIFGFQDTKVTDPDAAERGAKSLEP